MTVVSIHGLLSCIQGQILTKITEIMDDDSGSWIVDEITGEVHGHLVASDMFGEGYIIPLHVTFEDMRSQLKLRAVTLPTAVDIVSFFFDPDMHHRLEQLVCTLPMLNVELSCCA